MNTIDTIDTLLKNNAKIYTVNINKIEKQAFDNYVTYRFILNNTIPGYKINDSGERELTETNVLYISSFGLTECMRYIFIKQNNISSFDDDRIKLFNKCQKFIPKILNKITKVNIVQINIKAHEPYNNMICDHPWIMNFIYNIDVDVKELLIDYIIESTRLMFQISD